MFFSFLKIKLIYMTVESKTWIWRAYFFRLPSPSTFSIKPRNWETEAACRNRCKEHSQLDSGIVPYCGPTFPANAFGSASDQHQPLLDNPWKCKDQPLFVFRIDAYVA